MRKALIAFIAVVSLAFAVVLVAAPKATNATQDTAAASTGIDILSLTGNARSLPEQRYPAY